MAEFEEVINLKTKTSGTESVKSLKQEIKEAQAEALKMSRNFGDFSKEATAAAKKVATLKDEMGDFQQRVAALNPDRFQAIAGITQGIAGGITAATGAMALFGGESEDVQKVLVKVQGAIAFSQGIQQILDLKNSFGAVASVIRTQLITAFSTLKGAIISTGIGALVVAIGFGVQALMEMGEEAKDTTKDIEGLDKAMDNLSTGIDHLTQIDLANAKARGASTNELRDIELQAVNDKLMAIDVERARKNDQTLFEAKRVALERQRALINAQFNSNQAEAERQQEKKRQDQREQDQKAHEARMQKNREETAKLIEQHLKNVQDIEDAFWQAELAQIKDNRAQQDKIAADFIKNDESRRRGEQARKDYYAKKDKERNEETKKQEEALIAAKMAGYDATSQLLGNISSLFAQGSAEQKTFAIAQILVDEAKSIAATIAGATQAAAATGPAAPFVLGGYIISGLATVAANFKRVKDILGTSAPTPAATASAPSFNPVNSSFLPGSDEVAGGMRDMRVYVLEGDITKTQGRQQRNRNVSVI